MQTVWVVTRYYYGDNPIIDIFDNASEALKCYRHYLYLCEFDRVDFNEYPIHKEFKTSKKE